MKRIVAQPKELIASYVAKHIGNEDGWRDFSALALLADDRIDMGVIYHRWSKHDVWMHVALTGPCTPEMLFAVFDYPFNQVKVKRVTGLVPASNTAARRLDEHLGFVYEGTVRKGGGDDDLIIYGMLKEECKWISGNFCGRLAKRWTLRANGSSLASA